MGPASLRFEGLGVGGGGGGVAAAYASRVVVVSLKMSSACWRLYLQLQLLEGCQGCSARENAFSQIAGGT